MNNDQIFKNRARVLDEDLAGQASTAGADALLTQIISMEHTPARRRLLPSPRRALLGMAAIAALAGAIVVGPSLFGASEQVYASQAVTIDRVGDEYAFYFTDGDPDPAELEKAFHKVGLDDLTVKLIPVSPRMPAGSVFGFEKSDPDARATFSGDGCPERVENCITAFRVTADIEGPAQVRLGRPAKPGEKYAFPPTRAGRGSAGRAEASGTFGGRGRTRRARAPPEGGLRARLAAAERRKGHAFRAGRARFPHRSRLAGGDGGNLQRRRDRPARGAGPGRDPAARILTNPV